MAERRRGDINDEAGDCAIQAVIGQSVDPEKISRTAEREARRRRRRLSRKDVAHKEGQSSDEEVCDKESTVYTAEKGTNNCYSINFESTQCRVLLLKKNLIKFWRQWDLNPGHFGDWQWRWPLG